MKQKIFFTLIFVVIVPVAFAQTYYPLVDTNKLWSTAYETYTPWQLKSKYFKFSEDTLINSYTYKKIMMSADSLHSVWSCIGFIREDSTKKVFNIMPPDTTESLLYDFNVNIGDTIYLHEIDFIVDTVDTIFFGEKFRRKIIIYPYFDTSSFAKEEWYEGIGSLEGLLESGTAWAIGSDNFLLCFYENDILKYINPQHSDCYVNINYMNQVENSEKKKDILLYPNPANNQLNIYCNLDINDFELVIYDIYQRIIRTIPISEKHAIISLNDLNNGLYFCMIKKDSQILIKVKLIIQKF